MSLNTSIQSVVKNVLTALSDLSTSVTVIYAGAATYNTTTGAITASETSITVNAILLDLGVAEITNIITQRFAGDPNEIKTNMKKVLIAGQDISTAIKAGDKVTISSVNWDVVFASLDPAGGVWELIVRST